MNATSSARGFNLLDGLVPDDELCKQLKIVQRTSRKWRQTGEGPPFVKIGDQIFYPLDEYRKWLKKRVQQAARGR